MRTYMKISIGIFFTVVFGSIVLVDVLAFINGKPLPLWGFLLAIMILAVAFLFVFLDLSLKRTLYSYKNIMLIGAILFLSALTLLNILYSIYFYLKGKMSLSMMHKVFASFPKTFSYYAMLVIALISLLVFISNIALIRHEGFRPKNALGLLLAAVYVGGTVAVYFIVDRLAEAAQNTTSKLLGLLEVSLPMILLLILCYFECILVGCVIMGWLAARRKPGYDKDYIIILGCRIDKQGGLLPLLKGRVNSAVHYAWEQEMATGKPLRYVPSGGQGPNEVMSEGSAMELYLKVHGAEDDEVFPEKKSATTYENFAFSKEIIDALDPDAKIAFATTDYHILRSGIIAQNAGIDAEGVAGESKWYFWPNGFVREFYAIIAMNAKTHFCVCAIISAVCILAGFIGI